MIAHFIIAPFIIDFDHPRRFVISPAVSAKTVHPPFVPDSLFIRRNDEKNTHTHEKILCTSVELLHLTIKTPLH